MHVFCESDASCRTRPEEAGEKLYRKGDTFSVDFYRKGECKLNKQRLYMYIYIYIYIYIYLKKIVGCTFRGKS